MSANVIKVHSSRMAPTVSRITKEEREASSEAKAILESAQERAAQLLESARLESEKMLADSIERGYAEGLNKWNETLADAWKKRDDFLAENESQLLKLAVAIAKRIIGESMKTETDVVFHIVSEVLRSIRSERTVTIKVNPSEEANLRLKAESLNASSTAVGEIVIAASPSIALGGCVVESDLGTIDAQIETQLASMERALLRRFDAG